MTPASSALSASSVCIFLLNGVRIPDAVRFLTVPLVQYFVREKEPFQKIQLWCQAQMSNVQGISRREQQTLFSFITAKYSATLFFCIENFLEYQELTRNVACGSPSSTFLLHLRRRKNRLLSEDINSRWRTDSTESRVGFQNTNKLSNFGTIGFPFQWAFSILLIIWIPTFASVWYFFEAF